MQENAHVWPERSSAMGSSSMFKLSCLVPFSSNTNQSAEVSSSALDEGSKILSNLAERTT